MTMAMLALTLVFLSTSGMALFGAFMASRKARRGIERRVSLVIRIPQENLAKAPLSLPMAWMGRMGAGLRRLFTLDTPRQWGMHTNNATLLLIALTASMAVWLLTRMALGFSYWFVVPLVAGIFLFTPYAHLRHEQNKAEKQFMNAFPDSIDMVVRMLRAGLPITGAIRSISLEASPPVNLVFAMLNEQVEIGIPLDEALDAVGGRIGLPDFRFFAVAVSLQSATGGNLASTLEILTDIMRKRRMVRLKAQAATAEVRLSAYVLGALPFFVIGVLLIVNPSYLAPLVKDPRGNMIVGIALCSLLIAFVSMRQMMRSITTAGP
jgi:tight adherence protein B